MVNGDLDEESYQTYDLISDIWRRDEKHETYDLIGTHSAVEANQRNYCHSNCGAFEQGLGKENLTKLLHHIYGCK